MIETGLGHRRVRGCGSNSPLDPWDFLSWFLGSSDVEEIEGWARLCNGPHSSPAAVPGHLTPLQASDYLYRRETALRAILVQRFSPGRWHGSPTGGDSALFQLGRVAIGLMPPGKAPEPGSFSSWDVRHEPAVEAVDEWPVGVGFDGEASVHSPL